MSGSLRPEDLEPEEVSTDVVARAMGYQSAEHWQQTERQAQGLTERLQQLEAEHPVWAPDGHGDPMHTAVQHAVVFWKEVCPRSCLAREIPRPDGRRGIHRLLLGSPCALRIGLKCGSIWGEARCLPSIAMDRSVPSPAMHICALRKRHSPRSISWRRFGAKTPPALEFVGCHTGN